MVVMWAILSWRGWGSAYFVSGAQRWPPRAIENVGGGEAEKLGGEAAKLGGMPQKLVD